MPHNRQHFLLSDFASPATGSDRDQTFGRLHRNFYPDKVPELSGKVYPAIDKSPFFVPEFPERYSKGEE